MKLKYLSFLLLLSCETDIDKKTFTEQQKTIDSLQNELKQYKILHSVAKEVIENDSTFTE